MAGEVQIQGQQAVVIDSNIPRGDPAPREAPLTKALRLPATGPSLRSGVLNTRNRNRGVVVLPCMKVAWPATRRGVQLLAPVAGLAAAQRKEVRDRGGRLLGWVAARGDGILEARDRDGQLLGAYESRADVTRDRVGRVLYRGEALAALIVYRA